MALLETWGKKNRVVDEQLRTTYERETLSVKFNGHENYYFKYTRHRTKSYKYVGMTEAAAVACARALNDLYNRIVLNTYLRKRESASQGIYGIYLGFGNGFEDVSFDEALRDLPAYNPLLGHRYLRKRVGEATPRYTGNGGAWDVSVSISEDLETMFIRDAADPDNRNCIWYAFESNPTGKHLRFCGLDHPNNENYDDGEIGFGSPDGVAE